MEDLLEFIKADGLNFYGERIIGKKNWDNVKHEWCSSWESLYIQRTGAHPNIASGTSEADQKPQGVGTLQYVERVRKYMAYLSNGLVPEAYIDNTGQVHLTIPVTSINNY